MNLIIIAGMPASGKSTVSTKLSRHFGFPIIEKDEIKEELFDTIGFNCYAEKRRLDVAATAVLMRVSDAILSGGGSMILVNNFREDASDSVKALLEKHGVRCVTVFFKGDADVFYQRYVDRDLRGARHIGHAVQEHYPPRPCDPTTYTMTREEFREKFEMLGMDKFDVGGARIEVDATHPGEIDTDALIAQIEAYFKEEI